MNLYIHNLAQRELPFYRIDSYFTQWKKPFCHRPFRKQARGGRWNIWSPAVFLTLVHWSENTFIWKRIVPQSTASYSWVIKACTPRHTELRSPGRVAPNISNTNSNELTSKVSELANVILPESTDRASFKYGTVEVLLNILTRKNGIIRSFSETGGVVFFKGRA